MSVGCSIAEAPARPRARCEKRASGGSGRFVSKDRSFCGNHRSVRAVKYRLELHIGPGGVVHRYYDSTTGQFVSVDPLVGVTGEAYGYVGGDPGNELDPTGLCTSFLGVYDPHCWLYNEFWKFIVGVSGGPFSIPDKTAKEFLKLNGMTDDAAQSYVDSFVSGTIRFDLTSLVSGPVYRYYRKGHKKGYFFSNTLYTSASEAQSSLHLRYQPTCVAQVSENWLFPQQDLILRGQISGGDQSALQYVAYDMNEFAYGSGVEIGSTPPSPPIVVEYPTEPI